LRASGVLHSVKSLLLVAALLTAVAACTATTTTTGGTSRPTVPASSAPAVPTPTPSTINGNIQIAPTSDGAGPFKITPLHCGKLTSAEQNQFATNATSGLIYRYTNDSSTITGSPDLSVNFTTGSTVDGNNVTGDQTAITPGQSAEGEVDAVSGSGQNLGFTDCELMSYQVASSQGALPLTFAP